MSLLNINAVTALTQAGGTQIKVELTDGRGDPVVGFGPGGVFVAPSVTKTDDTGLASLDMVANADIQPANTYYTVTVGSKSFLIEKSGATQTLQQALVGGVALQVGPLLTSDALLKGNNLSDLTDDAEARDNLGLGNSATLDVGEVAGTVAAGDDPRFITSMDHNLLTGRDIFPTHPAGTIEFTPYLGIVGEDVQTAVQEVYDIAVTILDEADEISFAPTGTLTSTNVQDAIVEARLEAQSAIDHVTDVLDAHDASAISFVPSGGYSAGNVQDALIEALTVGSYVPVNGSYASTGIDAARFRVTGDTSARLTVNAGGDLEWTNGATVPVATDGNLRRNTTSLGIKTDGSFAVAGGTISRTASTGDIKMRNIGTIKARNFADSADIPVLTVDTSDDVTLGAALGDTVKLATAATARLIATDTGVQLPTGTVTLHVGSSSNPTTAAGGITFGSSQDTNLYRSAANTLKTDDAFVSATSVTTPFISMDGTPALTGTIRMPNDGSIVWRNFANTVDVPVLTMDTSNNVVLNGGTGASLRITVNGSDRLVLGGGGSTYIDGAFFAFGTTLGSKFGTTTSQKIGFWNATPVVQPSSTGEFTGYTAVGGTAVKHQDNFTGNLGTKAYTINDIVKHLKTVGILASS